MTAAIGADPAVGREIRPSLDLEAQRHLAGSESDRAIERNVLRTLTGLNANWSGCRQRHFARAIDVAPAFAAHAEVPAHIFITSGAEVRDAAQRWIRCAVRAGDA